MAFILSVFMYFMGNRFVKKEFTKKSAEITQVNTSIASMILEKKSAILTNTIGELEYFFSSQVDLYLKGNTKEFEQNILKVYDKSFAKSIDIFFFQSADGKYVFDASSPFYDTKRIRNNMMANSRFLRAGPRIVQAESKDGTLVALSVAAEAVSSSTGELAGYIYAGILLNNSNDIISEIMNLAGLSEAAIIYGDSIIAGSIKKDQDKVIETCYNPKHTFMNKYEISSCNDLSLGNGGVTVKFYQSLPDSSLDNINSQNRKMGYTAIALVLVITIILGYIINYITVRSLYKLVDYTKLLMTGDSSERFGPSMIYEFNMLADQLSSVSSELIETQAYLKNLINHAEAPIAIWDSNGNITLFNQAMEKLSGYSSENVTGKHLSHIYSIFPEAHVPVAPNTEKRPKPARFESVVYNKTTNVPRYVLWSLTDVFTDDNYSGTIIQGIDITERKDAESKLLLASKVFENTLEGMLITDEKGDIISCNSSFTTITGYKESEVVGVSINVLRSGKHNEQFYRDIWKNLSKYGRWSGEFWQRKKDGDIFPSIVTISSIRNSLGEVTNFVAVIHDITERKTYEDQIRYQATHDTLTGLPNRFHFNQMLSREIEADEGLTKVSVLFMDIDRFKNLNETLGHLTGDRVLEIISERIRNRLSENMMAARFGGDEFGVLIKDVRNKDEAAVWAREIMSKISEPIIIQGYELFIQMSAGLSFYPENGRNASELVKNAEIAMYQAKQRGRNSLQHFTGGLDIIMKERLIMESKLNRAIENNELSLFYQPKVDIGNMEVMGMEALLRWNNPELGSVPPDVFISLAEETGLILPIGEWVILKALEDTKKLHEEGFDNLRIAVNISLRQFMKKDLVAFIRKTLEDSNIENLSMEFEITESIFSEDLNTISRIMDEISGLGIKFAVDDFGTGYSSIGYLKKMPISTLKIDRSYINIIEKDSEMESIVSSVILMAKSLGLSVVAEGAEIDEQIELLKEMGCNVVQGYYFGKPMPLDDFRDFLKDWK